VVLWEKMEADENNGKASSGGGIAKYFSTHPHSQERLMKLKNAANVLLQNAK
jgi:Zn-dependent protease with chaperone function